jgi:hypothetical protein
MLEVRLVFQMIEDGLAEVASCTFTTGCAIFDIVVKELIRISIQGERRGDSGAGIWRHQCIVSIDQYQHKSVTVLGTHQ